MMERNYPSPSFSEPVSAAAQSAGWAYKPSSNYGSTQLESELLQRQTLVSGQQSTFTSTHHPSPGVFSSTQQSTASSNTTESSVMTFLSATESRGLQAGPAGTNLLPPFRSPSWQTGSTSSTDLFLTGSLHPSGTFSPSALSYQHPSAFPTRNFTTTSALAVQDGTFSSSNGLLSTSDPPFQLRSSQNTVPTAIAFDRLNSTPLCAGLPPQSSTYRSAQESAPHLLQPQFSLLSTVLGSPQQVSQPYGCSVYSERVLQRECSVIKHHQRPSSNQPVQEQLIGSDEHSLQGYLHNNGDISYQQDTSPHTPVPCSPAGNPSPLNVTTQKTQEVLEQTQAFASSVPSAGVKGKEGSTKIAQHPVENLETHPQTSSPNLQSYSSPAPKQTSVIANQSQSYSCTQLPDLDSVGSSHPYISSTSMPSNLNQTETFSSGLPEKLPFIYKSLSSFPRSDVETSVSQNLIYSPRQDSSSAGNQDAFETQVETLCMDSASQSYSSSHSQVLPTINFYSQGVTSSSISLENYVSGPSLTGSVPNPSFSQNHVRRLSSSNQDQDYSILQDSSDKIDSALLQKKYLSFQSLTSSRVDHNQSTVGMKPAHVKTEHIKGMNCNELSLKDVQALQKGSVQTSQNLPVNDTIVQNNPKNMIGLKIEERHNTQSVICSSSRSEDQTINHHQPETTKEPATITPSDPKTKTLVHSTQTPLSVEPLKQTVLPLKSPSSLQHGQIVRVDPIQLPEDQTHLIQVPSAQVLEPSHMIVLQQSLVSSNQNQPKEAVYMQQLPVQYLQMNTNTIHLTVNNPNTQQVIAHSLPMSTESKQNPPQKNSFGQQIPHYAKENFPLSSVFPDSVLLADERNILSNVDDILAATAAACGVTPQDFVKSTSSDGDIPPVGHSIDSKGHFQTVENQLNSFSSEQMTICNSQTVSLSSGPVTYPKDQVRAHQTFTLVNLESQRQPFNNSAHEISEVSNSHEKSKVLLKRHFANSSNDLSDTNGLSVGNNVSSDCPVSGQEHQSSGPLNDDTMSKVDTQLTRKDYALDDNPNEHPNDGLARKRSRSKGSSKLSTEDLNTSKSQKRTTQVKRPNSRPCEQSSTSTPEVCPENYQQQERMRLKLKEVEEKQPEVKIGFMGSFLDFLKTGHRQSLSSPPVRSPSRTRKPSASKRLSNQLVFPFKSPLSSTPMMSPDPNCVGSSKRLEEDFQRNLDTLPSFSSDEDDSVGKNQDLQKSITSALFSLDEPSDKRLKLEDNAKQLQSMSTHPTDGKPEDEQISAEELTRDVPLDKLAAQLHAVAVEGLMGEEQSDSGGEGMYRERDEFVVKNEDIEKLKITLKAGVEPPAIWKVQKALLQKFVPELRDSKRVFFATNSYLGYFGDAKAMYRRVYVKFLDTVNKREYVRVCSRKPRCKSMHSMRGSQAKALLAQRFTSASTSVSPTPKTALRKTPKSKPKQPKAKAEPPPKKRKKWKEEFTTSQSEISSPEAGSENEEFTSSVPLTSRFLNTRAMKESFKCYVELLVSVALDADVVAELERERDEMLLPHMKRVDGMITDNRRRLLPKLCVGQIFKNALDSFPELSLVTERSTDLQTMFFKVRLGGKAYNRKTMKPSKSPSKLPLEYTVDQQKTKWFSLYHSLQHYKYHTYLMCMEEVVLLKSKGKTLGPEETVQTCMGNRKWVEGLFDGFGELLTQVQQACL